MVRTEDHRITAKRGACSETLTIWAVEATTRNGEDKHVGDERIREASRMINLRFKKKMKGNER